MSDESKIVMLSLISESSKKGWLGITKLQKLSFLIEHLLLEEGKRAFDYEFFMYDLGPMSTEVYRDFEFLMNKGLVIDDEKGIRLSEFGRSIENQFRKVIPKKIISTIEEITDKYAPMRTEDLVRLTHHIKIKLPDGTIACIEDLPKNTTVLPKKLRTLIEIGEEYLETFRILSDKFLIDAIRQEREKGSKSKKYAPVMF